MLARAFLYKESSPKGTVKRSTHSPQRYIASGEQLEEALASPQFSWNFGNIRLSSTAGHGLPPPGGVRDGVPPGRIARRLSLPIQAKLAVGAVDDPLEGEADRVADQVMRMPDPTVSRNSTTLGNSSALQSANPTPSDTTVQRACSCGGSCAKCKSEQYDDEHGELQRKPATPQMSTAASSPASSGMSAPPIVHEVLRSPGQPLDRATRAFFEPYLGRDLGRVKVHADARAGESAQQLQAEAYTVGRELVFAPGKYAPHTSSGKRLLAHELSHVVQQDVAGRNRGVVRRAPWGSCPKGPRANTKNPFIYTPAELYAVGLYKTRYPSHCLLTNEMLAAGDTPTCKSEEQPIVNAIIGKFHHGRYVKRRSVASPSEVTRRPEGKKGALIQAAVEAVAALQQPDITDITAREVYDITTVRQRNRKKNKIKSRYLPLLRHITGENWSAGDKLPPLRPLSYRVPKLATICFGPTDFAHWPGVIQYEAIKPKDAKTKKKGEEEDEKKKKARGDEDEEEKNKSRQSAGNIGFGIGILSSGGGGRNAVLGVAINSHGTAYGTVSAGIVYDANGNAVATVTAGAGAHVSGNALGTAAAGTAKNASADAALSASAGKNTDSSGEALATASAGTAKETTSVSVATASHGHAEDTDTTKVAKTGRGSGGDAGGGVKAGAPGASPSAKTGARGTTAGGGLQIPGRSQAETQKAVDEAAKIDAMLQKATPAQKELLAYLAQTMGNLEYEVGGPEWVKTFMTATAGLSEEEIKYLQQLRWKPGKVSATELRKQIDEKLKDKDKEQGGRKAAPDEQKKTGGKAAAVKDKPDGSKRKLGEASPGKPGATARKIETTQEVVERLYKRAREFNWHQLRTGGEIVFGKEGKVYGKPISVALYFSSVIKGKRIRITADVGGILTKEGDHDVFEVRSSSLVVSTEKRIWPASVFVGRRMGLLR